MAFQWSASSFANSSSYEVQRTNHFEIIIPMGNNLDRDAVGLAVESVKIPSMTIEVIELKHGNDSVKVAGGKATEGGDIVFKDLIGVDIEKKLYDWWTQIFDQETGLMGNAVDYKKVCRLIQYSPDGEISRTWKLLGCFPTNFDPGEMSYENKDKKMVTMTLSVDSAIPLR